MSKPFPLRWTYFLLLSFLCAPLAATPATQRGVEGLPLAGLFGRLGNKALKKENPDASIPNEPTVEALEEKAALEEGSQLVLNDILASYGPALYQFSKPFLKEYQATESKEEANKMLLSVFNLRKWDKFQEEAMWVFLRGMSTWICLVLQIGLALYAITTQSLPPLEWLMGKGNFNLGDNFNVLDPTGYKLFGHDANESHKYFFRLYFFYSVTLMMIPYAINTTNRFAQAGQTALEEKNPKQVKKVEPDKYRGYARWFLLFYFGGIAFIGFAALAGEITMPLVLFSWGIPVVWYLYLLWYIKTSTIIPFQLWQGKLIPEDKLAPLEKMYLEEKFRSDELSQGFKQKVEALFLLYRQGKKSFVEVEKTVKKMIYAYKCLSKKARLAARPDEREIIAKVERHIRYFDGENQDDFRQLVDVGLEDKKTIPNWLHGKPGTGKSKFVRDLGPMLGGRTLTIDVSKMKSLDDLKGTQEKTGLIVDAAAELFEKYGAQAQVFLLDELPKLLLDNPPLYVDGLSIFDQNNHYKIHLAFLDMDYDFSGFVFVNSNEEAESPKLRAMGDRFREITTRGLAKVKLFVKEDLLPEFSKELGVDFFDLTPAEQAQLDAVIKAYHKETFRDIQRQVYSLCVHIKRTRLRKAKSPQAPQKKKTAKKKSAQKRPPKKG